MIHCKYEALVDPKKIKLNSKNRNKHSKEQIDRLARLIEHYGFRHPLIVSKQTNTLLAGHGRFLAAKQLGIKEVPVDYQNFKNTEEEQQWSISDNSISAWSELDFEGINIDLPDWGPDFDIDLLGIKDFTLDPSDKLQLTDPDDVPEVKESIAKLGDIWTLGDHRLMCGDSTNLGVVEKLMSGEKADMVFTDPPYGINEETDRAFASRTRMAKGNTFSKIIGDDSIDTALAAYSVCESMSDIVCYWGGNYYAHKISPSACWIVWDKRVDEKQRDMNSDCELAYVKHPNKKSIRIFRHLWKGMIKDSEHGNARVHPTQKPIALAEWCFNELNPDGKIVLDLFGGSGSTLIACEKTNRKCFMMELDPHYCSVILKRWADFTGRDPVREDGVKWSELCVPQK